MAAQLLYVAKACCEHYSTYVGDEALRRVRAEIGALEATVLTDDRTTMMAQVMALEVSVRVFPNSVPGSEDGGC